MRQALAGGGEKRLRIRGRPAADDDRTGVETVRGEGGEAAGGHEVRSVSGSPGIATAGG
jgi:hypothetical protein